MPTENENGVKPRPVWERAIHIVAFLAGVAMLIAIAGRLLGDGGASRAHVDVHVYEVHQGDWKGIACIAAFLATIALVLLAKRRRWL